MKMGDDYGDDALKRSELIFDRPNTVLLSPRVGLIMEHMDFMENILSNPNVTTGKCVTNFEEGVRPCVIM